MAKYALWGGRRGSVQIGSQEDRLIQAWDALKAPYVRLARALTALGRAAR